MNVSILKNKLMKEILYSHLINIPSIFC